MYKQRRKLLLGGAALVLGVCGDTFARPLEAKKRRVINLANFGGVPGASAATIISAFNQAFNQLKGLGGGTLKVSPGVYNLGSYSSSTTAISVTDLQNVLISAYGVQLNITTNSTQPETRPIFFRFQNPNNVTVAGMSFFDAGVTDLNLRVGAVCFYVGATRACSKFKTVDCVADHVSSFLQSIQSSNPYLFEGFDLHATIKNSFYGVTQHQSGRFSKCNLNCLNVRRAFISYGARDWDITVTTHRTGGPGSNAHVALIPVPSWPVRDCNVTINASGALNAYAALSCLYHQGPVGSYSVASNVKFNITINNATSAATLGFISLIHEPAGTILPTTAVAWENIQVRGVVNGPYNGRIIANPSVSSASNNSVYVASKLAALQDMSALPKYFHINPRASGIGISFEDLTGPRKDRRPGFREELTSLILTTVCANL